MNELPTFFKVSYLQTAIIVSIFPNIIPNIMSDAMQSIRIFVGMCLLSSPRLSTVNVVLLVMVAILIGYVAVLQRTDC